MKLPRTWRCHYILDDEHHLVEVDLLTWARWLENDAGGRRVAWTQVTSEITVSTVFLGLDHRHIGEGPPIVFETMVFAPDHIKLDGGDWFWGNWMWRYSSWDDAEAGHKATVRKVRAAIGQRVTADASAGDAGAGDDAEGGRGSGPPGPSRR